jgi:hypothetical protein
MFSEKAWTYRVKLEARDHSGIKGDHHSYEIIRAQTMGDTKGPDF